MTTIRIDMPRLHEGQLAVKQDAARFKIACCGRRWGKNVLDHDFTMQSVLAGHPVGWASPTYKNLADDWRMLKEKFAPVTANKSEQDKRLELITGGVVEMWSLDSPDPIRGRYYARWIINEPASVNGLMQTWNEILRPTLVDLRGDAIFSGTPAGRNDYWRLAMWGQDPGMPDWGFYHYTSYDNPYIDPAELDEMKSTLTEREFRQEIMAEFLEGEGSVFRNIDGAMNAPLSWPNEHPEHTLCAGVDWGKHNDFTAISIGCVDCAREVAIDRFNQIDYAYQRQKLERLCKMWGVRVILAELNAMGEPIVEELQRSGLRVEGFKTTRVSKAPLIEGLALAIETSEVQFLNDELWKQELEAYERTESEVHVKYGAPEGMHDDTVMARALMYRAMQHAPRASRHDKRTKIAIAALKDI